MSDSLPPHGLQHTRLLCPLPTPRAYSNSPGLRVFSSFTFELISHLLHVILILKINQDLYRASQVWRFCFLIYNLASHRGMTQLLSYFFLDQQTSLLCLGPIFLRSIVSSKFHFGFKVASGVTFSEG